MLPLLATALLPVVIVLVIAGIAMWALLTYVPLEATLRKIIIAVVAIGVIAWLFHVFGLWDYLSQVKV